jgi:hypothetical protein
MRHRANETAAAGEHMTGGERVQRSRLHWSQAGTPEGEGMQADREAGAWNKQVNQLCLAQVHIVAATATKPLDCDCEVID